MRKGIFKMEELKNPVRTTVYLDEEILRRCHILFGEAKVDSFSSFVRKALDCYIDYLITDQPHSFISEELAKTIRDEVRPIDTEWSEEQLEYVRKFANARVAKSKGVIDLKTLLDDHWGKEYEDDEQ